MTGPRPIVFLQTASRGFHLSLGLVAGVVGGVLLLFHLLNHNPALAAWVAGVKAEVANPAGAKHIAAAKAANARLALIAARHAHRADSIGQHDSLVSVQLDSLRGWLAGHPSDTGAAGRFIRACTELTASCSARADNWRLAHVADSLRADTLRQALDTAVAGHAQADSLLKVGLHVHAKRCGWNVIVGGGGGLVAGARGTGVGTGLALGLFGGWGCRP